MEFIRVEYPWGLIDRDKENRLSDRFPWRDMSPEEYAAHHAHNILVFGYGAFRFHDKDLQSWMHRLAEILSSEELLREAREQFLTAERRAEIATFLEAQKLEFERFLEAQLRHELVTQLSDESSVKVSPEVLTLQERVHSGKR